MKRGKGDELFATKRPIILTAADVKFKAQMKVQYKLWLNGAVYYANLVNECFKKRFCLDF